MKTQSNLLLIAAIMSVGGGVAFGQSNPDGNWRVSVGYRALFNTKVSFANRDLGPSVLSPPGVAMPYADGYVGTDSTGNALDLTTYWGYERDAQWAGDSLAMRTSLSGGLGSDNGVWANGMELVVGYVMANGISIRWGFEAGFGYNRLESSWSGAPATGVLSLDAYPLGGVIPPAAPYSGPQIAGPGVPLLGATPATVPLSVAADLDADIYGIRLGPYFEFPALKCCSFILGGGLSLAIVDSEASFRETAAAPYTAVGFYQRGGETDVLPGAYLLGQVNVSLGRRWDAFTGIQYHTLCNFKQNVGDKVAKVDLNNALAWVIGVHYRF